MKTMEVYNDLTRSETMKGSAVLNLRTGIISNVDHETKPRYLRIIVRS